MRWKIKNGNKEEEFEDEKLCYTRYQNLIKNYPSKNISILENGKEIIRYNANAKGICINCGNEIPVDLSKRRDRKYCSDQCRNESHRKNRNKK